jgi:hypothetical protein
MPPRSPPADSYSSWPLPHYECWRKLGLAISEWFSTEPDPTPYLHVFVGDEIKLDEIDIPKGVEVLEISDLQKRYSKCLTSKDRTVRGWSCVHIAALDPHNADSMRLMVARLDDDDWVKLNAVSALSGFTSLADEVIGKLRAVKTDDEKLKVRIQQTIETLRTAQPSESARKDYEQSLESIHVFLVTQRQRR